MRRTVWAAAPVAYRARYPASVRTSAVATYRWSRQSQKRTSQLKVSAHTATFTVHSPASRSVRSIVTRQRALTFSRPR